MFRGPVLPVLYSNLRHDTAASLRDVLDFLHVDATETDVRCAIANGEGYFHRKPRKWTRIYSLVQLFEEKVQRRVNDSMRSLSDELKTRFNINWNPEYDHLYTNRDNS